MKKIISERFCIIKSFVSAVLLILICIPCFNMTGNILMPISIALFGSILICVLSLILGSAEKVIGYSLTILMFFWLIFALIQELILQYKAGFVWGWIEFFYFDKLLIVGTVWLTCAVFFCVRRIVQKNPSKEYKLFFKFAAVSFLVFYIFLLTYSFILIRLESGDFPFRFQPFVTINEYISDYSEIPYEVFMMFFGNLLYFTPLGYIFSIILKAKPRFVKISVNLFFPIIAFTLLELSQYVFQNGYCEFDDMMMNSMGFWLGNLLCTVFDRITLKVTNRRLLSFWG